MKRLKRAIILGLASCIFSFKAYAMPEIMPFTDVVPGMNGVAYTVIDTSNQLREIDVNIIGTMGSEGKKGNLPRILAEVSGPVAESVGGVLSGMSGSPVYINGKLVGALSATLKETSPFRVLITPIEQMLPIWNMPDNLNKRKIQTFDYDKAKEIRQKAEERELNTDKKIEENFAKLRGEKSEQAENKGDTSTDVEIAEQGTDGVDSESQNNTEATPKALFNVSGFSGRDLDFLRDNLTNSGLYFKETQTSNSYGSNNILRNPDIQPGSAVGVAAVVGDFFVGALGTVTAVDGNKVLAFGHPFSRRGNVNLFMTDASVVGTVAGPTDGMKLADSTSLIGRVNQDRESGVGGIVGTFPQFIPVIVNVKNNSDGIETKYISSVAYNEDLVPGLTTSVAYAAMSKAMDKLAGSTADFKFSINTDAADNRIFERRNVFFDGEDVGKQAIKEMNEVMLLLCNDSEQEVDIQQIKIDIAVDNERKTATIVSAAPEKAEAVPGETINLKVVIKPYRKPAETLTVPYKIPAAQKLGEMRLDVHGGSLISVAQAMALQQQAAANAEANEGKIVTTGDRLREFSEAYMNSEIIVEPTTAVLSNDKEEKKAIKEAVELSKKIDKLIAEGKLKAKDLQAKPISRFDTAYIIDNGVHAKVNIIKEHKPSKDNKQAKQEKK